MPHCTIEYSPSVASTTSPSTLVQSVHDAALSTGLFHPDAIKTRAIETPFYRLSEQLNGYIHVCLSIMPGRTPPQKSDLCDAVLKSLADLALSAISITVETRDIERDSYKKHVG